jgi:hypothetical protein
MFNGMIKLNVGSKTNAKSPVKSTGKDEKIRDKYLSKATKQNHANLLELVV